MSQQRIAPVDDIPPGSRIIAEVEGIEICIFNIDGEFFAVANYCVHAGGPLCEGEVTGQTTVSDDGWMWDYDEENVVINCPWHLWKFDIESGQSVDHDQFIIPTFEVEINDGEVFVVN